MHSQQRRDRGSRQPDYHLPEDVINKGGSILVEEADTLAKRMKDGGLTTSQIRNIYAAVKKIQMRTEKGEALDAHQLLMLKPKLAYAAKRAGKDGADLLKMALTQAIDYVDNSRENFDRFVDFFEAILAYHKAHGGN